MSEQQKSLFSEGRFRHASIGFITRKPLFFFRALLKYAKKSITGQDLFRSVCFATSYKCNFKCSHCYAEPFAQSGDTPLSFDEKVAVIKECLDAGVISFDFVGGEIGLSDEFLRLLPHCQPHKTHISLASNDFEITREKVRQFKAAGVDKISISIDAGTAEEHDEFRRMNGSYQRCFEAIDNIRAEGLTPVIITCVSQGGTRKESFRQLVEYAINTRTSLVFSAAIPFGEWAGRDDILCDDDDIAYMRKMHDQYPFITRDCYENMGSVGCPATKQIVYISEYGDVMPCPFLHVSFGNVRTSSVLQIRERMMTVPQLKAYHPTCLTGEDKDFIKTKLSTLYTTSHYPPSDVEIFPEYFGTQQADTAAARPVNKIMRFCPLCGSDEHDYLTSGREHEFYNTTDDLFTIVKCRRCALVFLNPRPDDNCLERIYPPNYYCHTTQHGDPNRSLLFRFKEYLNSRIGFPKRIRELVAGLSRSPTSKLRVLDIGCGSGLALDAFKKYAGNDVETTGLDFSAQALGLVADKGHNTICGKLEEIDTTAFQGSFDIVYSSNVIEHVSSPLHFMKIAADALKSDGIFLCETPNFDSADARMFAPSGHWGGFHFPRHWTFFTPATFEQMATQTGFRIERIDFYPVPIFWIWTMHSIFYRGHGNQKFADSWFPLFEDRSNYKISLFNKVVFTLADLCLKAFTGKTSLMSIVMRKV